MERQRRTLYNPHMENLTPPFHLAIPVHDIPAARRFYVEVLHCTVGRESERWIDFNFRGHQLTAHLTSQTPPQAATNPVDGDSVPARHFGLILGWEEWKRIVEELQKKDVNFLIGPRIRNAGKVGEQATAFFRDPSGNAIELKAFRDQKRIFATHEDPNNH